MNINVSKVTFLLIAAATIATINLGAWFPASAKINTSPQYTYEDENGKTNTAKEVSSGK